MLIQHLTRCKKCHQQNGELWKRWLEDSFVMKTLVQKLFSIQAFFLRLILFKEAFNCHLRNFYCVILQKKKLRASFATNFDFIKKSHFYLKIWCGVKMLIQHLTTCENIHQQNDELWKRWLEDSFVMKTLVQKLFSFQVFFLRLILFREALNCHRWIFYGVLLQKKIFGSEFCNRIWIYEKHTSSWKLDAF